MKHQSLYSKIFLAIFILLTLSQPVLALEVEYPSFPGTPSLTGDTDFVGYILYLFVFSIMASGVIAVMSIVYSGIKILIAAGNPSAISEAKERIWGSILGIILLMFSTVILMTINPDLIKPTKAKFNAQPGPYLAGSADPTSPSGRKLKPAPPQIANTADKTELDPEYTDLYYHCGATLGKTILVDLYDQTGGNVNLSVAKTVPLNCGGYVNISSIYNTTAAGPSGPGATTATPALSYSIRGEDAGVYYYLKEGCEGISSQIQKSSGRIPLFGNQHVEDIKDAKVLSMRIVSGTDVRARYGVVLNKNADGTGECSPPITNPYPGSLCVKLAATDFPDLNGNVFNPKSAHIITQYTELPQPDSEKKVTLYSNNFFVKLTDAQIGLQYSIFPGYSVASGTNGYNGTPDHFLRPPCNPSDDSTCPPTGGGLGQPFRGEKPPSECTPADPKQTCVNNIEPDGGFYSIIYAKNDIDLNNDNIINNFDYTDRSCKVFNNGIGSLNDDQFLIGEKKLYRIDLIPRI